MSPARLPRCVKYRDVGPICCSSVALAQTASSATSYVPLCTLPSAVCSGDPSPSYPALLGPALWDSCTSQSPVGYGPLPPWPHRLRADPEQPPGPGCHTVKQGFQMWLFPHLPFLSHPHCAWTIWSNEEQRIHPHLTAGRQRPRVPTDTVPGCTRHQAAQSGEIRPDLCQMISNYSLQTARALIVCLSVLSQTRPAPPSL